MLSAFIHTFLDELPAVRPGASDPADPQLTRRTAAVRRLRLQCRYRAVAVALPPLIRAADQRVRAGSSSAAGLLVHLYFDAALTARAALDTPTAVLAADRAARAARLVGDPVLIAGCGFGQAYAALRERDALRARLIATQYLHELGGSGPAAADMIGMLHLVAALSEARSERPHWPGVAQHLDAAAEVRRQPSAGRDADPLRLCFDAGNIRQWTLAAALEAGQHSLAAATAADLHPRALTARSRRCALSLDLARLELVHDRPARAARLLIGAHRMAPQYVAGRRTAHHLLRQLLHRQLPSTAHRQLRRIRRQLPVAQVADR